MTFDPTSLGCQCDKCPLAGQKALKPFALPSPRLLILFESPTAQDIREGKPCTGAAGSMLDKILAKSGVSRNDVTLSHTILCQPPAKMPVGKWEKAIRACAPRLEKELEAYPGKYILSYGGHSLRALTKKPQVLGSREQPGWMGFPLPITRWKKNEALKVKEVLPTLAPSYGFLQPQYKEVTAIHTHRALLFAAGKIPEWTWQPLITGAAVPDALRALLQEKVIGFDTETAGLSFRAALKEIAFASATSRVVFDWRTASDEVKSLTGEILSSPSITKVIHNATYDIKVAWRNGIPIAPPYHDTLLASRLIRPGVKAGLDSLAAIEFAVERWKSIFRSLGGDLFGDDGDATLIARAEYASKDAGILIPLFYRQQEQFARAPLKAARFRDLMEDTILATAMTYRGLAVDMDAFFELKADLNDRLVRAKDDLKKFAEEVAGLPDYKVGSASPAKLFQALGVSSKTKTKRGLESFDATVVGNLLEDPRPLVRTGAVKHLTYKKLAQYANTQLNNLVIEDGEVHPEWHPDGAKTSRWSVSSPNVNQLAASRTFEKGELEIELPKMKRMFRARPGMFLVDADWKQAEARVAAVLADDRPSIQTFEKGEDIHTLNAIALSGGDETWARMSPQQRKDAREIAKTYLFGRILYGGSISTVWGQAVRKVPYLVPEALAAAEGMFFKAHPEVKFWRAAQLINCKRAGMVTCPGDPAIRLVFKDDPDGNPATQSLNFPIQSFVAWWMRKTMHRVAARLDWKTSFLLAQIYDCLLLEGVDPDFLIKVLREEMGRPWVHEGVTIPMEIDVRIGENWGEMRNV